MFHITQLLGIHIISNRYGCFGDGFNMVQQIPNSRDIIYQPYVTTIMNDTCEKNMTLFLVVNIIPRSTRGCWVSSPPSHRILMYGIYMLTHEWSNGRYTIYIMLYIIKTYILSLFEYQCGIYFSIQCGPP